MSLKDVIKPYGEDITTGMPDSILSGLYRTVLKDLGIEETRFITQVNKYIQKRETTGETKDVSSVKGTLRNELLKSVMTWKVFTKGLQVINVATCQIGVEVYFNDKRRSPVAVTKTLHLLTPRGEDIARDDTFLSGLFRDLMFAMGTSHERFAELLALYVRRAGIPANLKELASARGNIKKELFSPKMTWKVFIKGLVLLDVSEFIFAVRLDHRRGDSTIHRRSIILDQMTDETGDDDEE